MAIKFHQLIQQPALKITDQERLIDFYDVIADAVENNDLTIEGESTQTTVNELLTAVGVAGNGSDHAMIDWSLKQDDVLQEFIILWAEFYNS